MRISVLALPVLAAVTSAGSSGLKKDCKVQAILPCGRQVNGIASDGLQKFLGVNYAADTSGNNRFRDPQPVPRSKKPIDATKPGQACPQPLEASPSAPKGAGTFANVTLQGENCLNLDITRPAGTTAWSKLPVMVWIHGGSYFNGRKDDPNYNPDGLVKQSSALGAPVLFVGINYRLNFFGFGASSVLLNEAKQSHGSLNYGLLDQRFALQWIQENIASFGGDPSKVTIFGQSSGGTAVASQILAYGSSNNNKLFRGAIMESGAVLQPPVLPSVKGYADDQFYQIASIAGCKGTNPLKCLRSLSTTALFSAVEDYVQATAPGNDSPGLFLPVVDGTFFPALPSQLVAKNRYTKVPIMAGWSAQDGVFFTTPPTGDSLADIRGAVIASLSTTYPTPNATLDKLISYYQYLEDPYFIVEQIVTDISFACPAILVAQNMIGNGKPAYVYQFNETETYPTPDGDLQGAFHLDEIPYVFLTGLNPVYGVRSQTRQNKAFAIAVSSAWISFTATGNPNGLKKTTIRWNPFTSRSPSRVFLQSSGSKNIELTTNYNQRCQFYAKNAVQFET